MKKFKVGDLVKIIDCQRDKYNKPFSTMKRYIGTLAVIDRCNIIKDWYTVNENTNIWYKDWLERWLDCPADEADDFLITEEEIEIL